MRLRARNSLLACAVSALLLTGVISATPAQAETLFEALQATYQRNPKLNAERARLRAEEEKIPQARAGFLPSVNLDSSYGNEKETVNTTGALNTYRPAGVGVTLSQPLFNGRNASEYRRSQEEVSSSRALLAAAESQTLFLGAQAYMHVLRDRQILRLRQENLSNLRMELTQAQARYKAGDITLTGISQTRSRLAEAEADLAQSQSDLAESEANYRLLVGHYPGSLSAPAVTRIVLPATNSEAQSIAEAENPSVRSAVHLNAAAGAAIRTALGAYMPTVSLDGSYRRTHEENRSLGYDGDVGSIKLRLSVPLYSGGMMSSKVREAREVQEQRYFESGDALQMARKIVAASFEAQRLARVKKAAAQRRVAAAEEALKGLHVEFNAGQIPLVQVLDGRRELINARVSLTATQNDEVITVFQLMSALGRLTLPRVAALTHGGRVPDFRGEEITGSLAKSAPRPALETSEPSEAAVATAPVRKRDDGLFGFFGTLFGQDEAVGTAEQAAAGIPPEQASDAPGAPPAQAVEAAPPVARQKFPVLDAPVEPTAKASRRALRTSALPSSATRSEKAMLAAREKAIRTSVDVPRGPVGRTATQRATPARPAPTPSRQAQTPAPDRTPVLAMPSAPSAAVLSASGESGLTVAEKPFNTLMNFR